MSNRPENTIHYLSEITSLRRPSSWSSEYPTTPSVQRILCRVIMVMHNEVQGVWLKTGVVCFKKCFSMCLDGLKKSTWGLHWHCLQVMWSRIEPVIFGMQSAYTSSVIKYVRQSIWSLLGIPQVKDDSDSVCIKPKTFHNISRCLSTGFHNFPKDQGTI
jgi:hypothetical protein